MDINIRLAKFEDTLKLVDQMNRVDGDPLDFVKNRVEYYIKNQFIVLAENLKTAEFLGKIFFKQKKILT